MYAEQKDNMTIASLAALPQAMLVLITMLLLMTLYELMKQFFDLDIIIWQSPVIDIIFSSFIAGIVVHLVSKKQNHLYTQLERTYNDREQALFNLEREVLWCKENETRMKHDLLYKTVLLKDVHYRVKNNLQIISGLLIVQSNMIEDKNIREALRDSTNRIHSLALLHNKLYQSGDMSSLDYADYIKDLAAALADNHCVARNMPTLDIDVNVRLLDDNTLVSCSLLLSELISNSIKHAFADGRKGTITIYLCQNTNGDYILVFSDNGVGLPEGFNVKTVETPGMRLINDLITKRLHGTIELDGTNGTTFKICWNDDFTRHSTTNHERREVSYASCAKNWSYYYA